VLALLAILVLLHLVTWPVVLAVAVIDGGANALFNPSASAALPGVVADKQLERAWAATEARTYAAALVGPALGGFLFGLGRAVPFVADGASYLISAGCVSRIRGKFRAERSGERKALWREVVDGLLLVWRHPLLRAVVIQAPIVPRPVPSGTLEITNVAALPSAQARAARSMKARASASA
jgi:MFS family permease